MDNPEELWYQARRGVTSQRAKQILVEILDLVDLCEIDQEILVHYRKPENDRWVRGKYCSFDRGTPFEEAMAMRPISSVSYLLETSVIRDWGLSSLSDKDHLLGLQICRIIYKYID